MKTICLLLVALCVVVGTADCRDQKYKKRDLITKQEHGGAIKHGDEHVEAAKNLKTGGAVKVYNEDSKKGEDKKTSHKVQNSESGGKKFSDHTKNHHSQNHHSQQIASRRAKYADADKQKKTASIKGFRNQYKKNEHHKLDGHFSSRHTSGDYHKYGNARAQKHTDNKNKKSGMNKKSDKQSSDHHKKAQNNKFTESFKKVKSGSSHTVVA